MELMSSFISNQLSKIERIKLRFEMDGADVKFCFKLKMERMKLRFEMDGADVKFCFKLKVERTSFIE